MRCYWLALFIFLTGCLGQQLAAAEPKLRVDQYGDPLPEGAIARLGSVQFRQPRCSCIAFAPNGEQIASAGSRSTRLWNVSTAKRVREIPHGAVAIDFGPGSSRIALGSSDGVVRLWHLAENKELFARRITPDDSARNSAVRDIEFSPDGTWFASADSEGIVRLWDAASGDEILALRPGDERRKYKTCLAISPDSRRVASAVENNIRIWDIESGGEPLLIEKAHENEITDIAFSPDSASLLSAGHRYELIRSEREPYLTSHSQIRVWSAETGDRLKEITDQLKRDRAKGLVPTPDGDSLVVLLHSDVGVFDLTSGRLRYSIPMAAGSPGGSRMLDLSPDGKQLVVMTARADFELWDLATQRQLHPVPEAHVAMVRAVTFSADGRTAITGSSDGTVRLWNSATGEQVGKRIFSDKPMNLMSIASSPDGETLAAAGNYGKEPVGTVGAVRLWKSSGELLHEIEVPGCGFATRFSHNGERLAATTTSELMEIQQPPGIFVIDVQSGSEVLKLPGKGLTVFAVGFSPDDTELISIGDDGTISTWDLTSGERLRGNSIEDDWSAVISHDAAIAAFATSGRPSKLIFWDVPAGKVIKSVEGVASGFGAHALDISRDGRLALSGCQHDTLRVWSTATGAPLLEIDCSGLQIFALAFSPDGRQAITGMDDGTALIWDITSASEKLTEE